MTGSVTGAVPARHESVAEVLAEVRRIEALARRLVNDVLSAGYHNVFRGAGLEFAEVRAYEPGDDPRSVDWNVTARQGRLFVKTFTDERELEVVFVCDVSESMDAGWAELSLRGTAARMCGVLALTAVRNGDRVGHVAFADSVLESVPPRAGSGAVLRMVRDCLVLEGNGGGSALGDALDRVARGLRRHAVVFVASDFAAAGWERSLAACAQRHDVVAIHLRAPERRPAGRGTVLRVREPETGLERLLDLASARVRGALRQAADDDVERVAAALRRAGVDRIDVPPVRDHDLHAVATPLLRFFRMRELRGSRR